jgi:cytochrome c-type biogenesis protein
MKAAHRRYAVYIRIETMIGLLFALLAGILTVAAPCTLPILPILLGTSLGSQSKSRPACVALGFIVTFAGITLAFKFVTQIFGLNPQQLRDAAIGLLATFGALLLFPTLYARLAASMPAFAARTQSGDARTYPRATGGFLLGTTLGLVSTPCAGPVLGSILTLLATQDDVKWAAVLLIFYAAGAAIPMLIIGYGGQYAAQHVRRIAPYTQNLQRAFGVLVVGFAVAMYLQYDTLITTWLSNFYPSGQIGL